MAFLQDFILADKAEGSLNRFGMAAGGLIEKNGKGGRKTMPGRLSFFLCAR
jgi:hypothetical protein